MAASSDRRLGENLPSLKVWGQMSGLARVGFAWLLQGLQVNQCSCKAEHRQNGPSYQSPPARKYRKRTIFGNIVFTGLAARFLQRATARIRCSDTYYTATSRTLAVSEVFLDRSPFLLKGCLKGLRWLVKLPYSMGKTSWWTPRHWYYSLPWWGHSFPLDRISPYSLWSWKCWRCIARQLGTPLSRNRTSKCYLLCSSLLLESGCILHNCECTQNQDSHIQSSGQNGECAFSWWTRATPFLGPCS